MDTAQCNSPSGSSNQMGNSRASGYVGQIEKLLRYTKKELKIARDLVIQDSPEDALRVIRFSSRRIDPTVMVTLHLNYDFSKSLGLFNSLCAKPSLDGLSKLISSLESDINYLNGGALT